MAKVQIICIYVIKNPSGRIYIGQTWDLNKRYKSGVSPSQRLLYRSYQKHGKEKHTKQIIHQFIGETTQRDLDYWERRYIDLYKEGGFELLNIREGGGNNGALSKETKALIRQRKLDWIKLNPEKQKTITAAACAANTGKKRSEETKTLQSDAAKGKPKSEQHRLNASAAKKGKPSPHKGKHFSAEAVERIRVGIKTRNQKKCPVLQYSLCGEFIKEWTSIKEAADALLLPTGTIGGCVRKAKHYKTCGGFIWRYKSDEKSIVPSEHRQTYNSKKCPVIQYDLSGEFISDFETIKDAISKTSTSKSSLIACCRGTRKSAGGFTWRYK
jgi:group I intron endonuclease